jgi:hypothetical protein
MSDFPININATSKENISNKSTNVNTDQASNAKYPSVKALFDWATNLFFPKPTGTTSQYLRGDGSLATFPTIPSIAGLVPETRTINGLDLSANRVLTAPDVGAPSGSGSSTGTNTGDQTFLNARVQTVASSATVTATSTNDIVTITAQAVGLTLANPTGAFTEGQSLIFRIKDNGTARTIGYGANFRAIGVTAPTTTVANKTTYIGCIYNSTDSKFDIIGVCTEA